MGSQLNKDQAAFAVIDCVTGQRWAVYADGRVEGFGNNVFVVNRIPTLIGKAVGDAIAETEQEIESLREAKDDYMRAAEYNELR